jgi:hypothetical protein
LPNNANWTRVSSTRLAFVKLATFAPNLTELDSPENQNFAKRAKLDSASTKKDFKF